MPDHKYPLQMECLELAIKSAIIHSEGTFALSEEVTKLMLRRASAFLGWAQASTPSRAPNPALRPPLRIRQALEAGGESEPLEGPVR